MPILRLMLVATTLTVVACADADAPTSVHSDDLTTAFEPGGALGRISGGGHYVIDLGGGLTVEPQFAMSAKQTGGDESATGTFHHRLELFGEAIEFYGKVTCLAIDEVNGRAWIGGVVTKNRSVREPFASGDIYQPGKDIWFRVLDVGSPSQGADRTTFTGFEGGAGITTSAEYCATRPWPADNARTNALSNGNLNVMP